MRKEYDLADAVRGAALKQTGTTRITIMLDRDVVAAFRALAADTGGGYQTAINQALREHLAARRTRGHSAPRGARGTAQGGLSALRSLSAAVDSCEPGPRPRPVKATLRAPPHLLPFARPAILLWRRP